MPELLEKILKTEARENGEQSKASGPVQVEERKGSLCLKSNHMQYGPRTLNTQWHSDREAYPKDYDVTAVSDRDRNQHLATYKNIGFDEPVIPISTTKEGLEEPFKQKQFHEPLCKTTGMVNSKGFQLLTQNYLPSGKDCASTNLDHNCFRWQEVQARHNKLKTQNYETTNKADYTVPHPEKMEGDRTIPHPAMPSIDTFGRKLTDRVACDAHRRKGSFKWLDTYEPK